MAKESDLARSVANATRKAVALGIIPPVEEKPAEKPSAAPSPGLDQRKEHTAPRRVRRKVVRDEKGLISEIVEEQGE